MQVAAGGMSPLLRKLGDLLMAELSLDKRTRKGIESLRRELPVMLAALHMVGEVPPEQLDPVVKAWAHQVRELSYDMEDAVDAYMVRVEEEGHKPANLKNRVKKFVRKTSRLFTKGKDLRQIVTSIDDAQDLAMQLDELHQRYGLDLHGANAAAGASSIDPRLMSMYKDVRELVGISGRTKELIDMLFAPDGSEHRLKTVSIVGFGGLGKTTLAKAVYDKIVRSHFDCGAFVSIGRNPDVNKVFKDVLYGLDKQKYDNIHNTARDQKHLIDEVRYFLENKRYAAFFSSFFRATGSLICQLMLTSHQIDIRYFIIIDDIWNEKMWEIINCAFPENNRGNRVITTTRIISVSEKCCASHLGIYKMKPLSSNDSETLFYKRIFNDGKGCPQHLLEVTKGILKKCGGVPLAIITIASLLANKQVRTEEQWSTVLKSIGRGITEGGTVDDMRKILSFSYHDLPPHLKSCLLYMSVFPEDDNIRRDRLIWTWIAQGFVQQKEAEENSLFELGERCFNELINRSMVQLVDFDYYSEHFCRLHDMVLELICSLSREENFVSTLDDVGQSTCLQSKVRRLSLQVQDCRIEHTSPLATIDLSYVRSFTGLSTSINLIPSLSRFHVLRVLDLEGCDFSEGGNPSLRHISKLFHLRYLGLRGTHVGELPKGLGKLRFLQIFDLEDADIKELPSDVTQLGQLRCLYVDFMTRLPKGMGHLKEAQVLSGIDIGKCPDLVRELRNVTGLRELHIKWDVSAHIESKKTLQGILVESLSSLNKIHTLTILSTSRQSLDVMGECWVAPPHLRRFELYGDAYFSRMPEWIKRDPLLLTELSVLRIGFDGLLLQAEDMRILGMLPALAILSLFAPSKMLLIGPGFRCLTRFNFWNKMDGVVMFQQEAMPMVERLWLYTSVRKMIDDGSYDPGLGLVNLLSLEHADVMLMRDNAKVQEVEQVEAALMDAIRDHPNHFTLKLW